MNLIQLTERGIFPDVLVRAGMRKLISQRLASEESRNGEVRSQRYNEWLAQLRSSPIAIETQAANQQHYEVPADFFKLHLGPRLKYSCALYPEGGESLGEAEEKMFALYAERAQLRDGLRILDLGCGWGSLSLWLAEKYPASQIVGLSNSHGQRQFIEARAKQRGLNNVRILTGNVVDFDFPAAAPAHPAPAALAHPCAAQGIEPGFDRVMSIEMFEHMRNYGLLLAKISRWLKRDGRLFVHIFAHKLLSYPYEVRDDTDWMTQYFFLGGIMPSESLLLNFQDQLKVERQWWVSGQHYEKTSNHWLAGMDAAQAQIMPVFETAYGRDAAVWFQRWRMFYMAVAEFFGYARGNEWGVAHYLFAPRG